MIGCKRNTAIKAEVPETAAHDIKAAGIVVYNFPQRLVQMIQRIEKTARSIRSTRRLAVDR